MPGFITLTPYQYNRPAPQQSGGGYRRQQRGGAIPPEYWFDELTLQTPNLDAMFAAFARELLGKLQLLKEREMQFTEQQREDIDWHIEMLEYTDGAHIEDENDFDSGRANIVLADQFVKTFDKKP